MRDRLARLLTVLRAADDAKKAERPLDVEALAGQLGLTPQTVRRDLRDLTEASAWNGRAPVLARSGA
jgi:DeoR/GlpR family transcriptional regulator of sugar metabolism